MGVAPTEERTATLISRRRSRLQNCSSTVVFLGAPAPHTHTEAREGMSPALLTPVVPISQRWAMSASITMSVSGTFRSFEIDSSRARLRNLLRISRGK